MFLKIFFIVLCLAVTGCGVNQASQNIVNEVIDQNSTPSGALQELLTLCALQHDGTLTDIVAKTQASWLRPTGVERFTMSDGYKNRKSEFHPLFVRLNLISEVKPTKQSYDYALIHGGTILTTRARLAYVSKLWLEGVRFDRLVFLTGQRMLDLEQETEAVLCDRTQTILPLAAEWALGNRPLPHHEAAMMRFIYDQAALPAELRAIPLTLIDAPQIIDVQGNAKRPTTQTTIEKWLATKPKPGTCLAVSNQPFLGYQDSIARTLLPQEFSVETVGLALPPAYESVSMCLDSLARWLYQENMRRAKR